VYEIDAPDAEGSRAIALSIYGEIRNSHDWGRQFPEVPSESALAKLASLAPREMRRALQAAFGTAKLSARSELRPDDIQDPRGRKQRIGF
jgi:ATP-dependent Lon protease